MLSIFKASRARQAVELAVVAFILSGTSACTTMDVMIKESSNFERASNETTHALNESKSKISQPNNTGPIVSDRSWVSTKKIQVRNKLPGRLDKKVTINEPFPTPLEQVIGKMAQVSGISIVFDNDVVDEGKPGSPAAPAAISGFSGLDSSITQGRPSITDLAGITMQGASAPKNAKLTLSYQGSVSGMLDAAANAMRASWRYESQANRVVFFRYITKTFRVSMVPGSTENSSSVTTTSGQAGGGETTSKFGGNMSVWQSINDSVKTMISARGSYNVSEATGVVTVRDLPDVVDRVEEFITQLNDGFSRQVTVDIKVYRIENNASDIRGVNWNVLLKSAGFALDVAVPGMDLTGLGLSSAIVSIPDTAQGDLRHWVGSKAFMNSLSSLGRTSLMTSASLQTINNQPAPIRIGKKIAYLKQTTSTQTANVGSQVSMTPGEIDVGYTMQILPHVQENGRDILMQIMITLSQLDGMKEFGTAANKIQLPEVSSRDFMSRVWLSSGQSLILSGFESESTSSKKKGVIDAQAWILGGSGNIDTQKESIVIILTPVVTSVKNRI